MKCFCHQTDLTRRVKMLAVRSPHLRALVLTPIAEEEFGSIERSEKRIRNFGLAIVGALLTLAGGLAWWVFI
jgi:hypothetical protein